MTFQEFTQKKVLGVPVLYLAAGAVVILAVVAWRMKPTPDADTAGVDPEAALDGVDGGGLAGMDDPYGGYTTNGTVVVTPTAPETPEAVEKSNDTWIKEGAEWLVSAKKSTGTIGYATLNKYISGEDLSYEENALVNLVIAEKGQPPDPIGKVGAVADQPARKQFSGSTGTHTVKGTNDNTPVKLAQLYYGASDALHVNRLVQYNTKLGTATTTYPVGTKVVVPSYVNPFYYTVNGKKRAGKTKTDQYFDIIGSLHGASGPMIAAINPTLTEPIAVGTKVRIR